MDSLKQNRSGSGVCMREARAHAAAGFKERRPGGGELNKRNPYLKMCLPGDAGKGAAFMEEGNTTSGCQIPTPRAGRDGTALAACGAGVHTPTGPLCLRPLRAQLARDRWGRGPRTSLLSPNRREACEACPGLRGFCQHSVLCLARPSHLSLLLPAR